MTLHRNRKLLALALAAGLAACQQSETPSTEPAEAAPATVAAAASAKLAAAASVAAAAKAAIHDMDVDQLRQAAITAMSENRLYSPGGDNAIEYYLALRDKLPNDPNVGSALTDLAPYTAIAIGQNVSRNEFDEADRLTGLIAKIDPNYPALPRLQQNITSAKDAFQKHATDEQNRLAAQQKAAAEQQAAQQKLAAQQKAAAPATRQAEEAAQKAVASAPAPVPVAPPPTQAPQQSTTAVPAANSLRLVYAPPPRYPPDALRDGISGEVLLELTVGADGAVSEAKVVRSSPPRVFDREALAAVKRWKFTPIDEPITTRRTITFKPN